MNFITWYFHFNLVQFILHIAGSWFILNLKDIHRHNKGWGQETVTWKMSSMKLSNRLSEWHWVNQSFQVSVSICIMEDILLFSSIISAFSFEMLISEAGTVSFRVLSCEHTKSPFLFGVPCRSCSRSGNNKNSHWSKCWQEESAPTKN